MVRAVLFDLDGTLLDTLGDLSASVNCALSELDCPTHSEDKIRIFIGDGVKLLIARSLPADRQDLHERCLTLFKAHYAEHMADRTKPYPGIIDMLDALVGNGIHCAVITNKFDGVVAELCKQYFADRISLTIGDRPDRPKKPAPDGCNMALHYYGLSPEDALYVGDSDTDMLTAKNAHIKSIGVSWGFRSRALLIGAGADAVADDAHELLDLILREA